MKVIILGANGQDGYYLSRVLNQEGIDVIGISRNGNFMKTEIDNYYEISTIIKKEKPDYIFHLAANSTTNHSALFENHRTIATAALNILEAVKEFSSQTKVFISGSGLQFINNGLPIKETDPFAANDAYSISRIQSIYAARYFRTLGLKVYVGYFFNHDSPLRSERHVTKKISESAKRIRNGSKEKLEIGDMSVIKEWSFAGDIVKGIWQFVNQDKVFEANISSGKGYSIQQWVEQCFSLVGLNYEDYVFEMPTFVSQYKILVSDNRVIRSIGYKPEVDFKQLAELMINNI